MNKDGKTIMDYFVIPRDAIPTLPVLLHIKNRADVDAHRAADIEVVAKRIAALLDKSRPRHGLMLPQLAR